MVFVLDTVLLIAYGFSLPIAVPPIPSNFDFKKFRALRAFRGQIPGFYTELIC